MPIDYRGIVNDLSGRILIEAGLSKLSPWADRMPISRLHRLVSLKNLEYKNKSFPWGDWSSISNLLQELADVYYGYSVSKPKYNGRNPEVSDKVYYVVTIPYDSIMYIDVTISAFREEQTETYSLFLSPAIKHWR